MIAPMPDLDRRRFLSGTAHLVAGAALAGPATALAGCTADDGPSTDPSAGSSATPSPRRPNVLLFTADDMNSDTPGTFGGPADVTPTVDRLASDGAVFRRAHVAVAVCQPSRSAMVTGRYPHHNGAKGFDPIRDDVPVLTDVLRPAGYRVGILGKMTHVAPVERFGWDLALDRADLGYGRDPGRYAEEVAGFLAEARRQDQPWFLMANSHDPHRPFSGSADEAALPPGDLAGIVEPSKRFEAGEWPTPGFLPDLPDVRTEIAQYLSSARRADDTLAAVLHEVDEAGATDDTLVIFLSDNGMSFPFAKGNCYLHSTRTPLIVRWPAGVTAGIEDDSYVSGVDLLPTICAAVGVDAPEGVDGRSFLPLLQGEAQDGRDVVHTVYHEPAQGQQLEMRCIQRRSGGLIWNAWADGTPRFSSDSMLGLTWPAMQAAAEHDPEVAARTGLFRNRVPEELYDFENDPDGLENLAESPEHAETRDELRAELLDWMRSTDDPLADTYATFVAET
jgi:N-sulfoglucosamine sulfohydrolase